MMRGTRVISISAAVLMTFGTVSDALAAGKIKGNAGGIERSAAAYSRDGRLVGWTITGPSGLYEFSGLEPGLYMLDVSGALAPFVEVVEGRTTVIDQADQPKLSLEMELWGPARVKFAQSFVARGTAVTGFLLWRSSGDSKLLVSLYEDSPAGKRVAGPFETRESMTWVCGSPLPAEQFKTTPGRKYAIELAAEDGKPWNHGMPRTGDVYPDGIAYYDGVPHPESDLGIHIDEATPGLINVAGADDDQHFIKEGPGSGTCTVAGQTFVATTPNILKAGANCGWGGAGVQEFLFSIHEDGPGGPQVGPACTVKMVTNWGADAVWFPDAVQVIPGKTYYLQYRRVDGEPFFSYLSSNVYKQGRAYRDGKLVPEQFDQLFSVIGEEEPAGIIYPVNVRVSRVTDTSAVIAWETGTPGDSLVHYGTTVHLIEQAGDEQERSRQHEVTIKGLTPGTAYMYRVSSHTYKKSSRRTYSRIYSFMTPPAGEDHPRFDKPPILVEPPACDDCVTVANPGFEEGVTGWTRKASSGRAKKPETYVPDAKPFGDATTGVEGCNPHSGKRLYGWTYRGPEDPTWVEPREDWRQEIIYQRISVEPGREYLFSAFLLTGDRGSGWGRDSRIRLAVDEDDGRTLESFDTIDQANCTQWFATHHRWLPVSLRFTPKKNHVTIGIHFLNWWALETNRLYVDEITVRPTG